MTRSIYSGENLCRVLSDSRFSCTCTKMSRDDAISGVDPANHLPLRLVRSEIVPPAPNRSGSSIDWLPDFAGYSWIAYGASTLLVISHLPSPFPDEDENVIAPIFRQVLEVSADASSSPVAAVSWSPVTPSVGEVAAAAGNCICLFSRDSDESSGSFCWSQNAVLVQFTRVETIEWTSSGDGILAGGTEVVLWRRRNRFWEVAWKFKTDQPQDLVSSTWSIEGPFAMATSWSRLQIECNEASKCVLVCYSDGKSVYEKAELRHPQPISMIQWRPRTGKQYAGDVKHLMRNVLLTCCLDGTVRLWCEIDDGKGRKAGREVNDQKTMKRSLCVAAVIEMNQALSGTLGTDVFLTWVTQIGGIFKSNEGANEFFSLGGNEHERTGKCEWLIGFGPGQFVTFWAVHCLDDISPMRFPRVTLWKRQEVGGIGMGSLCLTDLVSATDQLLLKRVMMRKYFSGPPVVCSLIHLKPSNSLFWSLLYTKNSRSIENTSSNEFQTENLPPYLARGVLDMDGHRGKILQVAFHPNIYDTELAVSLDSNGLLLLWSPSAVVSNCALDLPTSISTWKLCGRLGNHDSCFKYTSVCWGPSTFQEEKVLFMGHAEGIDCFVIKVYQRGKDDVLCHYICTIPFTGHGPYENGPTNVSSIPLPSSCGKTFRHSRFMLLGVWIREFQALSWEVSFHSYDLPATCCESNFDDGSNVECSEWKSEATFAGRRYCFVVDPLSSEIPEPHKHDQITSFAVVCPSWCGLENDVYSKNPAYTMATGQSDGSLKLWRSTSQKPSTSSIPWELVGVATVHQNPVSAISLSDCGRKIATLCKKSHSNSVRKISIFEVVHLIDTGMLVLEDSLSVDEDVVAVKWSARVTGPLLLGVSMPNEVRVYAQQRLSDHTLLSSDKTSKAQIWYCVGFARTFSVIRDFLWGPNAMATIVHDDFFSLFSPWLFLIYKKHQINNHQNILEDNYLNHVCEVDECMSSVVFTDSSISDPKESPTENGSTRRLPVPSVKINEYNDLQSNRLLLASAQHKHSSDVMLGFWSMLDLAEKLRGPLPLYHPQALLMNISSGNWKRAYASLKHLVEYLSSNDAYEKNHVTKSAHTIPEIPLSKYYEGQILSSSNVKDFQWNGANGFGTPSSEFQKYAESNAFSNLQSSSSPNFKSGDFLESIEKLYNSGAISSIEKMQILTIADLLSEVGNPHSTSVYTSLDEPGRRFWVALRFQQLYFLQRFGRAASVEELVVDSYMMAWAYHSDYQETLFGSVLPSESSWQEMRSLGIGFWYTDAAQLRSRMEKLARQQYLKNKNPKDSALLYVALNRVQVLAGLFKISKDEKDKPLVGFLSRNFQEEKNKAAALKNAYVLMGKHQLEMAITFFLLGGDTSSAVNVCVKNLCDEQLALVICRLVEGRGGQLEHHLITRFLLPSAVQRGDYWLASLLEWELGLYSRSFLSMVEHQGNSVTEKSTYSSNHVSFKDPCIGLYCLMLANKNSMKNSIGEQNAATLGRWATLMASIAFNRCGLPLEALECLSTSATSRVGKDQASSLPGKGNWCTPRSVLEHSASDSFIWVSEDVASALDFHARLDLALQFVSKSLKNHPAWPQSTLLSDGATAFLNDLEIHQCEKLLKDFQHELQIAFEQFERRFSVSSSCLVIMILASLRNHGLLSVGCSIGQGHSSTGFLTDEWHMVDRLLSHTVVHKSILKSTEGIAFLFSRFTAACSITGLQPRFYYNETKVSYGVRSKRLDALRYYFRGIMLSLSNLRASIVVSFGSSNEDLIMKQIVILDLIEYYMQIAIAYARRDTPCLFQMLQPLMITHMKGHAPYAVDIVNLKKVFLRETAAPQNESDAVVGSQVGEEVQEKYAGHPMNSIPEDESWQIIGACIWKHMSNLMDHKLLSMSIKADDRIVNGTFWRKLYSQVSDSPDFEPKDGSGPENIRLVTLVLATLLKTTLHLISSHHVKHLALFLREKIDSGFQVPTLSWFDDCRASQSRALSAHLSQDSLLEDTRNDNDGYAASRRLWNICVDPNLMFEDFVREKVNFSDWFNLKPSRGWSEMQKGVMGKNDNSEPCNHEDRNCNDSTSNGVGSPTSNASQHSWQTDTNISKETMLFQNPKEIHKRNGELIEALCINPINQGQAAIASNRKGIIFFNWQDGGPFIDQSDYIWSDADWPHNGWAGSESTPVPTCVSLGVGLGSKKGTHLGLGGATVGAVSLTRPRRDLTGGGAFGVPGYAGIGASALGWGTQDDFEQFVDPPPTVETISTRAFSSHPSMPLFLVGSSNTHIYLWEFGKDRATATYGVLPAANVPPPYALASISAVQFGPCGHRFASAALDGTVCTWQLEVGGRSNIHPVESSLCFNSHASDVKYITSSGSIIAASGYSSSGVNVVIWDTLAPPLTSQASIICHEGGARSIAVFDNYIGSGSISPIIVTGGKSGDVGLHDFRYIATGKTKRHRNSENRGASLTKSSNTDTQTGDQNPNGMLWYIPKAHLGSVTKISTIPNTSFFLTGSKDGDVKLWDAKAANLIYHWPKLHERHTFLQPSSRGYAGIIRAGITDIQVCSHGFLSCGGDGSVKLVRLKDFHDET